MSIKKNNIIIIGPLAFDYILQFDGKLIDFVSIDFEKGVYKCNIIANSRKMHFGGTAGNIAYNLGHLKVGKIRLISSVGGDFDELGYKNHINNFKTIKLGIKTYRNSLTASCYIVNDNESNQMIIFHEGAMEHLRERNLKEELNNPDKYLFALNSCYDVETMVKFSNQLYELGIPLIFDPGQKTTLFSKKDLSTVINKSKILIGNTYELNQIKKKIDISNDELFKILEAVIITKGIDGSKIIYKDKKNNVHHINIPRCLSEKNIVDPTGAGDGYRAGLLGGLILNLSLLESCHLGSVTASFVIETLGAQSHSFKLDDVKKRYLKTYKYLPSVLEML